MELDAVGVHGDVIDRVASVARTLTERGLRLALAESCTGGMIAAALTERPGASEFLVAGIVAYANEAKERLLGVKAATLVTHGAVSEAVAREMAAGALRTARADAAVAVTGIAGPGGGTAEKPVGTVWIAAALGKRQIARCYHFEGDRARVRIEAASEALDLLERLLEEAE